MAWASGKQSVVWGLATILTLVLTLLTSAACAESLPAAAWVFDLLARVEQQRPTGPLDFLPGVAKEQPVPAAATARIQESYGRLPMQFEPNVGQAAEEVKFVARGPGYTLFLTADEAVLALRQGQPPSDRGHRHPLLRSPEPALVQTEEATPSGAVVRMRLEGATRNAEPQLEGLEKLPGISNYFLGNDPAKWRTNVPHYRRVQYQGVYPGIDLVFYGNPQQLEYDFVLAPGADPNAIRLAFEGVEGMRVADNGDLILRVAGGELVQKAPKVYQEVDGERRELAGRYVLRAGEREQLTFAPTPETLKVLIGFQVASYQPDQPLVIDPVLVYSTYFGGSSTEEGTGIAVDGSGNVYVTGGTSSADFPIHNALYPNYRPADTFITKLNTSGTALVYSTYLGGSSTDEGYGIAVDGSGNVYVTGHTSSADFPTHNALYPQLNGGGYDAFIVKLNVGGTTLVYSTYLGDGSGTGIAVDGSGNVYVTGGTSSADFPTHNALYPQFGGGINDAFIAKLNTSGTALVYSTYLGGSNDDTSYGIAVDGSGNAYVTGNTNSTDFPTHDALDPQLNAADAFITKLNANGTALVYSTYLGGNHNEVGHSIAVDGSGNAYVTGYTLSADFPTRNAIDPQLQGFTDAFIVKLNAGGTALVYSTYLGGSSWDQDSGIVVDEAGNAYVTGYTTSTDFPTHNAPYPNYRGGRDAFIAKLNASGTALVYSTYLGGSTGDDMGYGIAVDGSGSAYVTGVTHSADFPTVDAIYPNLRGAIDAFIAKIGPAGPAEIHIVSITPSQVTAGQPAIFAVSGQNLPTGLIFSLPGCTPVTTQPGGTTFQSAFGCTPLQLGSLIATVTDAQGQAVSGGSAQITVTELWRESPGPGPTEEPPTISGTRHLVLVTHGWNSSAEAWPNELVRAICAQLGGPLLSGPAVGINDLVNGIDNYCYAGPAGDRQHWLVGAVNWAPSANTGLAGCPPPPLSLGYADAEVWCPTWALANAKKLGKDLAKKMLATNNLPGSSLSAHLIGHSAGSGLIDEFAKTARSLAPGISIQMTLLDAFCPDPSHCSYGSSATWAEQYFDTRDFEETEAKLPHAYNFDVTSLDRMTGYSGINAIAYHAFPYKYYIKNAGGNPPDEFAARPLDNPPPPVAAYLAPWISGVNADPIQHIATLKDTYGVDGKSLGPCILKDQTGLGLNLCSVHLSEAIDRFFESPMSAQLRDSNCSGQFQLVGGLYQLSANTCTPQQQAQRMTTAEATISQPGMVLAGVNLEGPANRLSFDYRFTQTNAAGLLQVFLDGDTLVYVSNQDSDGITWHSTGRIDIAPLTPGQHFLRVVAKSEDGAVAGVMVSNVRFEQANSDALPGDVNGDGKVDALDLVAVINHFLGLQNWWPRADCNGDGKVDALDMVFVINRVLGK